MSDQSENANSGEFDTGPPFVFGIGFKDGATAEMRWEDVASTVGGYEFVWLHLNMNNEETRQWIHQQNDIPDAAKSALLADETRPRVTQFDNGLVANLRGVNLNEGADPEDMVSIRIWLNKNLVITTRRRRLKAAQDIHDAIKKGLAIENTGALVSKLATRLTDRMEPHVLEIEEEVDALEDEILKGAGHGLRAKLAQTRQSAVHFRRFVAPQREAVARFAVDETGFFDQHSKIEIRETADKITRLVEEIDAARERAMVLQDQLTDQRAEEMNRNMMILSIVAAIFLPLGFLTGLFGINVGGMPGVDSPQAFWLVVLASIFISFVLILVFKLMKWL